MTAQILEMRKIDPEADWNIKQERRAEKAKLLQAKHPEMVPCGSDASDYVTAAKNIRIELKREFPNTKFSVKSKSFSMGNSIDVSWTDGPTDKQVEAIINKYNSGSFDGMTDCYNYEPTTWTDAFGESKYVNAHRSESDALILRAIEKAVEEYGDDKVVTLEQFRKGDGWNVTPMTNTHSSHYWTWQSIIHRVAGEISEYPESDESILKQIVLLEEQNALLRKLLTK